MNKKLITFIILYLIIGIIWQIYSCISSPLINMEPDIPCVSIYWTPMVLLGWPLFGLFDLIGGFIVRGLITIGAFGLAVLIPYKIFKKHL